MTAHEEDSGRGAGQVSDCRDHQESHHAALPLSQRREFTVNAITSFPYSGTSWKRHYGGGQGRANISVIYTSEIKRESAGKAARDVLAGRGRVPCGPAGTPTGLALVPELPHRRLGAAQARKVQAAADRAELAVLARDELARLRRPHREY